MSTTKRTSCSTFKNINPPACCTEQETMCWSKRHCKKHICQYKTNMYTMHTYYTYKLKEYVSKLLCYLSKMSHTSKPFEWQILWSTNTILAKKLKQFYSFYTIKLEQFYSLYTIKLCLASYWYCIATCFKTIWFHIRKHDQTTNKS